jgi:hypothetical protein
MDHVVNGIYRNPKTVFQPQKGAAAVAGWNDNVTGQAIDYNSVGDTQGGVTTREHFGGQLRRPVSRSPHLGDFLGPLREP